MESGGIPHLIKGEARLSAVAEAGQRRDWRGGTGWCGRGGSPGMRASPVQLPEILPTQTVAMLSSPGKIQRKQIMIQT